MRSRPNRKTFALKELKHRLRPQAGDVGSQPAQPSAPKKEPAAAAKKRPLQRKKRTAQLSTAERALFRQAMHNVEPLRTTGRRPVLSLDKDIAPAASQQQLEVRRARAQQHTEACLDAELSDDYFADPDNSTLEYYLNPACGTDVLRDLKRGRWPLQASIDLHGATLEHARLRLQRFLQHALAEQFRCIRIVHGKGHGSVDNKPVLRHQIRRWLTQLDMVLALSDCPPNEGGSGAVKVLLRKARQLRQ